MIEIGYTNKMKIVRFTPNGAYLDGEDLGEVLLPKKFLTPEMKEGVEIDAFLYFDSEDRLTATIQHPYTEINRYAYLECVAVTSTGAFLSWGLDKDLLVPKSEKVFGLRLFGRGFAADCGLKPYQPFSSTG